MNASVSEKVLPGGTGLSLKELQLSAPIPSSSLGLLVTHLSSAPTHPLALCLGPDCYRPLLGFP